MVTKPNPIIHVITGLDTGGAEGVLANLVLQKTKQKKNPLVVSLVDGGFYFEKLQSHGCRVIGLGMRRGQPSLSAILRLIKILKSEKPSVVQSWMYHADIAALFALMLSGRRSCTKLFWGIRCSDMDPNRYRYLRGVCSWLSGLPDGIIANSHSGLEFHIDNLGYRPKQATVIHNCIDMERYHFNERVRHRIRGELGLHKNTFVVAAVARVDVMKDYPTFISALSGMRGVTAIAVGKGTEVLPKIPNLMRLGERHDISDLLSAIDVLVSASAFGEGFSNVLAEAMACQRAVISTNVGDAARLIGGAGLIIPPSSPDLLNEAIKKLRNDGEMRKRMGEIGRKRIATVCQLKMITAAFDHFYEFGENTLNI